MLRYKRNRMHYRGSFAHLSISLHLGIIEFLARTIPSYRLQCTERFRRWYILIYNSNRILCVVIWLWSCIAQRVNPTARPNMPKMLGFWIVITRNLNMLCQSSKLNGLLLLSLFKVILAFRSATAIAASIIRTGMSFLGWFQDSQKPFVCIDKFKVKMKKKIDFEHQMEAARLEQMSHVQLDLTKTDVKCKVILTFRMKKKLPPSKWTGIIDRLSIKGFMMIWHKQAS